MAAMSIGPVGGLAQLVGMLDAIERGAWRYPLYSVLLYTREAGVDEIIGDYVSMHRPALDAMTGDDCLLFFIDDVGDEFVADQWKSGSEDAPHGGHTSSRERDVYHGYGEGTVRRLAAQEVYNVARWLGVRPSSLPCATFFVEPDRTGHQVTLKLAEYIPDDRPASATTMFRAIASAIQTSASFPEAERLDTLKRELVEERRSLLTTESMTVRDRVDAAAGYADAVEEIANAGTIAGGVLGGLAKGLL